MSCAPIALRQYVFLPELTEPVNRMVVVGDEGPLKTRLLKTYVSNKYDIDLYVPTVFENYAINFM